MIISLITAPLEPAPIEPEVETFRDTAEVTEVKTEGTFYTNKLYSHQLFSLTLYTTIIRQVATKSALTINFSSQHLF